MNTVRVGLIGTGYMGKCHALAWNAVGPTFADSPAIRLAHLAEIDTDLARKKAKALGFEKSTGDWRELIKDPEVDVVSITTPNAFHAEMVIAALEAGKHVWCEKPMAPRFEDACKMREAARASGLVAALGYNYIQNPMIRQISKLVKNGEIGQVNHIRVEMDEDFMADPNEYFNWKSEAASGYGALDDFAVHPLSLIWSIVGRIATVTADMARPYNERPLKEGGERQVDTYDVASALFRMDSGASGVLTTNRAAWGRKGRIALQIFASKGSITYDQERMNELRIYYAEGPASNAGYKHILAGPDHPPYDEFLPAPGHGLGFNDLKVIECHELLTAIDGRPSNIVDFETGLEIERVVHGIASAHHQRGWVEIEFD